MSGSTAGERSVSHLTKQGIQPQIVVNADAHNQLCVAEVAKIAGTNGVFFRVRAGWNDGDNGKLVASNGFSQALEIGGGGDDAHCRQALPAEQQQSQQEQDGAPFANTCGPGNKKLVQACVAKKVEYVQR
jgi:hypothetical protein